MRLILTYVGLVLVGVAISYGVGRIAENWSQTISLIVFLVCFFVTLYDAARNGQMDRVGALQTALLQYRQITAAAPHLSIPITKAATRPRSISTAISVERRIIRTSPPPPTRKNV